MSVAVTRPPELAPGAPDIHACRKEAGYSTLDLQRAVTRLLCEQGQECGSELVDGLITVAHGQALAFLGRRLSSAIPRWRDGTVRLESLGGRLSPVLSREFDPQAFELMEQACREYGPLGSEEICRRLPGPRNGGVALSEGKLREHFIEASRR